MTYVDFLREVILKVDRHSYWRLGQSIFNVLHENRPDLSARLVGGYLDPYYMDSADPRLPMTLAWIEKMLFVRPEK